MLAYVGLTFCHSLTFLVCAVAMGDAATPLEELETVQTVRVLQSSGEVAYAASMPKTSTIKDRVPGFSPLLKGGEQFGNFVGYSIEKSWQITVSDEAS